MTAQEIIARVFPTGDRTVTPERTAEIRLLCFQSDVRPEDVLALLPESERAKVVEEPQG